MSELYARDRGSAARASDSNRLLTGVGLLLIGMCAGAGLAKHDELAATLAVLGVGVILVAAFAPRLRGPVELGPSGMKFELEQLTKEAAGLSAEIGERLDSNGVGLADLATGQAHAIVSVETHADIRRLLESLDVVQRRLDASRDAFSKTWLSPAARLKIARGLLTEHRWTDAAAMLDRYVEAEPGDWEAQFARGVAHANTRGGRGSDLAALRAYNEALAFAPQDDIPAWLPRFFTYRGAMLKRLERLPEAENDLLIARKLATSKHDVHDIDYNLAAVYAMSGRGEDAMHLIRMLSGTPFIAGIRAHVDDYFRSLCDDSEFVELVRP